MWRARQDSEPLATSEASGGASRKLADAASARSGLARPAGLEPATPGLKGSGYEATGDSVEPLPPYLLGFSQAGDYTRPPQTATDCLLFVNRLAARAIGLPTNEHDFEFGTASGRRLRSGLPVSRPSMAVRDGHDQNALRFDAVDDAEWKAPKQIAARVVVEARPCIRKASDGRFGCSDFIAEGSGRRSATFCIPARRRFRLLERFVEILKLAGHVRLPRGCGDAPPTTEWSRHCPRRRVRVGTESRQTMRPPHRRRLRARDSESARQRARLALHQKVEAPRTGVAWHP
jgi:hypothetical protein